MNIETLSTELSKFAIIIIVLLVNFGCSADKSSSDQNPQSHSSPDSDTEASSPSEIAPFTFDYAGISYPTPSAHTLPSGIMPNDPTPNSAPGWQGYDPILISNPKWDQCDSIYREGDGFPANLTLSAGEVLCFENGLATAANYVNINALQCTASEPCWMYARNGGGIYSRRNPVMDIQGKHLIIEGMRMDADRSVFDIQPGSKYITIRNNHITGTESDGGGAGIDIAGTANAEILYVMIYRNFLDDIGPSDKGPSGAEAHQVRPSWYSRYIWIIENTFGSSDGDAIQTGNSKTTDTRQNEGVVPEKSPHYIWVAGNKHEGVSENFIDNKNSYHVIISENDISVPMRETVILLSNDGEGFWTGHHWAISNRLVGGGQECIGIRGNESNIYGNFIDFNYVISNIAYNCNALLSFQSGNVESKEPETYVLYNTLVSNKSSEPFTTRAPIYKAQNRQEKLVEFIGNIIYGNFNPIGGSGGDSYIAANNFDITTFKAIDNVYYQVGAVDFPFLSGIDADNIMDTGNLNSNPLFIDEGERDFSLKSDSPALNYTQASSEAFDRFRQFYGMDLKAQLKLDGINNAGADQN